MKTKETRKKILSNIRALSFGCFSHDNDFIDNVLQQYANGVSREVAKKQMKADQKAVRKANKQRTDRLDWEKVRTRWRLVI